MQKASVGLRSSFAVLRLEEAEVVDRVVEVTFERAIPVEQLRLRRKAMYQVLDTWSFHALE
jgi:hypothetical protein